MLGATVAKHKPRNEWIEVITSKSKPQQKCGGYSIVFWQDLDKLLTNEFEV